MSVVENRNGDCSLNRYTSRKLMGNEIRLIMRLIKGSLISPLYKNTWVQTVYDYHIYKGVLY